VVEERVVVELKAVERLQPVHEAQLLTYLKLTAYESGLLINFNVPLLKQGLRRINKNRIPSLDLADSL
jgi:GxxExxY protein